MEDQKVLQEKKNQIQNKFRQIKERKEMLENKVDEAEREMYRLEGRFQLLEELLNNNDKKPRKIDPQKDFPVEEESNTG